LENVTAHAEGLVAILLPDHAGRRLQRPSRPGEGDFAERGYLALALAARRCRTAACLDALARAAG
jgi:hypothetical protein